MITFRLAFVLTLLWLPTGFSLAQDHAVPDSPLAVVVERFTGPWDLPHLRTTPRFEWGETVGTVREVFYENEPYRGQPSRVFAYYARPAQSTGPFPGMVLVHGGGGTAFQEWAELWAERGYTALAMDLAGHGPGRERLADGGPDQTDAEKFGPFDENSIRDMWTYHAVAAVIRGHSLLASMPETDAARVGVTGISWGGYLTCIVAGLDDRFQAAVPVYGCGFLHENSVWLPRFAAMTPDQSARWIENFEPSRYLPGIGCPVLFVNGTNDFAYPLDSYRKSYLAVPARPQLCVTVRMPHSHPAGWNPVEIGLFIDSVLRDGVPLPELGTPRVEGDTLIATVQSQTPIRMAQLHYTTDDGAWQQRVWHSRPALLTSGQVSARLPSERPLVAMLTVTNDRDATVSTEHQLCEP